MKRITVLLAEDHTIVRQGLRLLIEADGDIEIVGEAKTGREAVQMTGDLRPEIVVMDIAMPLLNGLEATRQILKAFPRRRCLFYPRTAIPSTSSRSSRQGPWDIWLSSLQAMLLPKPFVNCTKEKLFLPLRLPNALKDEYQKSTDGVGLRKKSDTELTSREAELLQLIAEGHVNKQIASELGISIKTVEKHRQHLMEKLNIHDIAGLTRFAIAAGIIESSVQSTIRQRLNPFWVTLRIPNPNRSQSLEAPRRFTPIIAALQT
jgi:DNA-binding NarL/FixJ family response regulator